MTRHPVLTMPDQLSDAESAVADLVDELQRGLDESDADVYNAGFSDDVVWGGPFGATVVGYDALHRIHVRLLGQGAGASRYEIVNVTAPLPHLAIAHVRRRPLNGGDPESDPESDADFAEMALYVLVEHGGRWWLVAGQNTVVQPGRSATD